MKEIPLDKGFKTIVDDEDYKWLSRWKWRANPSGKRFYAVRVIKFNGKSKNVYMHKEILNCPAGMSVDHINHDSLDNRKENLRVCNSLQNAANTLHKRGKSGYIGVFADGNKWRVKVSCGRKTLSFGTFNNPIDVAIRYDSIVKELHGEFAVTNF